MITVCAWCERYLGSTDAELVVTHGICAPCASTQRSVGTPTIVVARHRAEMHAVLEQLLSSQPSMRVVLDRRMVDRRRSRDEPESAGERRGHRDRRRSSADAVLI